MESRVVTTVRLPADLAARAKEYAKHRDVTLTVLVEAALRNLLHDAQGGVPELEETSSRPEGRGSRGRGGLTPAPAHASPASSASPRAPGLEKAHIASVREMHRPAPVGRSQYEEMMRARQGRLNKGKG